MVAPGRTERTGGPCPRSRLRWRRRRHSGGRSRSVSPPRRSPLARSGLAPRSESPPRRQRRPPVRLPPLRGHVAPGSSRPSPSQPRPQAQRRPSRACFPVNPRQPRSPLRRNTPRPLGSLAPPAALHRPPSGLHQDETCLQRRWSHRRSPRPIGSPPPRPGPRRWRPESPCYRRSPLTRGPARVSLLARRRAPPMLPPKPRVLLRLPRQRSPDSAPASRAPSAVAAGSRLRPFSHRGALAVRNEGSFRSCPRKTTPLRAAERRNERSVRPSPRQSAQGGSPGHCHRNERSVHASPLRGAPLGPASGTNVPSAPIHLGALVSTQVD